MKKPELVIFDVDGLLLNTEYIWQKAWQDTGIKYGIDNLGSEIFPKCVGISGEAVRNVLYEMIPDHDLADRALTDARICGQKRIMSDVKLMPGAEELLHTLEAMKIPKAIATTTARVYTEERLRKLNIYDRFDYIICGDEVKNRKPDPEIYLQVLRTCHTKAENALVLEDTGYGTEAAYRAGIPVIMVPSINMPERKQLNQALMIVKDLYTVDHLLKEQIFMESSH